MDVTWMYHKAITLGCHNANASCLSKAMGEKSVNAEKVVNCDSSLKSAIQVFVPQIKYVTHRIETDQLSSATCFSFHDSCNDYFLPALTKHKQEDYLFELTSDFECVFTIGKQ